MDVLRLPTLNKSLNDEKKLADAKGNKNKLVIEFRMLVSTFLMNALKNGLSLHMFLRKPTRAVMILGSTPITPNGALFLLSFPRFVLPALFPGTLGANI